MRQTIFITGTDTGVGKTVLTALLARYLRERGVNAVALKPVGSGGRDDARALHTAMNARALHTAMNGVLTLDEINPWHFRAPIAPLLAARREHRRVRLAEALAHVRAMQERFDVVLVEGAGGLLSPLGVDFNSRELMLALRAAPVIVGPNRVGVVNQVLLLLGALPRVVADEARVVLMALDRPDASAKTNADLLAEFFDAKRIFELPRLGGPTAGQQALKDAGVRRTLRRLTKT